MEEVLHFALVEIGLPIIWDTAAFQKYPATIQVLD